MMFDELLWRPVYEAETGGGGGGDAGDGGGEAAETGGGEGDSGGEGGGEGASVEQSIARLSERLDNFMESQSGDEGDDDLAGLFDPGYYGEEDDQYEDEGFGDEYEGDEYGTDEADNLAETADQIVEQLVDQKVQERLAPHLQAQHEERRHEQVLQLESRYPELKEQTNAVPLLREAAELAKSLGEPELAFEAPFLETVHLRMKAEAARTEESGRAGGGDAPIEGAGGSNQGSGESAEAAARKLVVDASERKGIFG